MKIRLTQPGFEAYNGQMGVLFFEDGLSTADVRMQDAVRMAAVMNCEWEDGTSPSVSQAILDNAHTEAPQAEDRGGASTDEVVAADAVETEVILGDVYTEEDLSVIADEQGIKGLRAIGDPNGIKGNSIKELIKEIASANIAKPKA